MLAQMRTATAMLGLLASASATGQSAYPTEPGTCWWEFTSGTPTCPLVPPFTGDPVIYYKDTYGMQHFNAGADSAACSARAAALADWCQVEESAVQMIFIPPVAAAPSPPLLPPLPLPPLLPPVAQSAYPTEPGTCWWEFTSGTPTCPLVPAFTSDPVIYYKDRYGMEQFNAGADSAACFARAAALAGWCGVEQSTVQMIFIPPTTTNGDPITSFQGEETRYWLSMEHFTPIFEQGPLVLSQLAGPANPPPGLENHKGAWVMATELTIAGLDSILVEAVDPTTLLARPNATAPPAADALTTMRLSFAGKQLKAGEHKLSVSDMTIAVSAKADPDQKIGRGFVEQIDIKAEGLHLRITSSKANKFADETLQVLGLHLDVQFLSFEQDKVRGALPEMWGLQPMSKETKLLLEKPAGF